MARIDRNTLFYGDNLPILRQWIDDESIDLIYLDPPFNSNRSYNILFKDESGEESEAQLTAFDDSWHWGPAAEETFHEIVRGAPPRVIEMIAALRNFIGSNQMMAYLVMMTARLVELHRVLKPTGSLYLHCDPTASHYLKIILDTIFGFEFFQNEIIWKRTSAHNDPKKYGNIHDVLLFYSKGKSFTWNPQYTAYSKEYLASEWRELPDGRRYKCENMLDPQGKMEEFDFMGTRARWRTNYDGMLALWEMPQTVVPGSHGRIKLGKDGNPIKRCRIIFLDEMKGVPLQSIWDDVHSLRGGAAERLGYPTQKPQALLERVILSSSSEGELILDPFCGCGTAIAAAQALDRRWIGIDVTHLAISLQKYRLQDSFDLLPRRDYQIVGEPEDLAAAEQLARDDPYQFQWWALSLIRAKPLGGAEGARAGRKGADRGVDGIINFVEGAGDVKKIVVQVKGGKVSSRDIRDLKGAVDRDGAAIGLFLTLANPTRDMVDEAVEGGFYSSKLWGKDYPKIQIRTIEQLLDGRAPEIPPTHGTFKRAERVTGSKPNQTTFDM